MAYYVKLRKGSKPFNKLTPRQRRIYHKEPTLAQIEQREKVVRLAKSFRGLSTAKMVAKFEELGYYPTEKRIYQSGGVGSWCYLPKFAIFRVQVRASHISTKGAFMPYALCVEV